MRLLSCSLTRSQIRNRSKDVTRRLGWEFLKPGELLCICEKVMGRRKGEPLVRMAIVVVISVRREPLNEITRSDVVREGFCNMTCGQFITMFCDNMSCEPNDMVTRIEFQYIPGGACLPAEPWRLSTVDEGGHLKPPIPVEALTTVNMWNRGAIMPLPENATVREVFRPGNVIAWRER